MTIHKMTMDQYCEASADAVKIGDTIEIVPDPEPTGSERVVAMLRQGKPVLCNVSDISQDKADTQPDTGPYLRIIKKHHHQYFTTGTSTWKYASPVDLSQFAQEVK